MSAWGCPHDDRGRCDRRDAPCDPGEPGCVLEDALRGSGRPSGESPGGGGPAEDR